MLSHLVAASALQTSFQKPCLHHTQDWCLAEGIFQRKDAVAEALAGATWMEPYTSTLTWQIPGLWKDLTWATS